MSEAEDREEAYYAVFDMAYDERKRLVRAGSLDEGFVDGALWGAGWAFAIVGMAQAIRSNPRYIGLDPERMAREMSTDALLADVLGARIRRMAGLE